MRQFFGVIDWERKVAVFLAALFCLVAIGPFGTYSELSLARRFVFWTILMLGIGGVMQICIQTCIVSPYCAKMNRYLRVLLGSAIAAIPGAGIVGFVIELFIGTPITLEILQRSWFQITILGFIIGGIEFMIVNPAAPNIPTDEQPGTTAFHARLNLAERANIISMSMQDHYVEVTTAKSKELILIRFSDALSELNGLAGQRIHRSHWIAATHLRKIEKDGPRHMATLSDGRALPVSATYLDRTEALLSQRDAAQPKRI